MGTCEHKEGVRRSDRDRGWAAHQPWTPNISEEPPESPVLAPWLLARSVHSSSQGNPGPNPLSPQSPPPPNGPASLVPAASPQGSAQRVSAKPLHSSPVGGLDSGPTLGHGGGGLAHQEVLSQRPPQGWPRVAPAHPLIALTCSPQCLFSEWRPVLFPTRVFGAGRKLGNISSGEACSQVRN
ncbi:proline-rich protein 2-like isoform X2 [Ailuropoda melanoleuca]|uniref:proline-rich protein 2-like isoform X2 n=1 Tax=Ailuropoda melanoleuca TaxID=9646 RepID=UPI0014943670|nr:proline-rich protein 2-like isoform X2 [Ailuropoda melanoleuca]